MKIKRITDKFSIAFPTRPYLWRLAKATELYKLDALLAGGLYMARLDRFNDPREGALGQRPKACWTRPPLTKSDTSSENTKMLCVSHLPPAGTAVTTDQPSSLERIWRETRRVCNSNYPAKASGRCRTCCFVWCRIYRRDHVQEPR
jgi:hypothetical protein